MTYDPIAPTEQERSIAYHRLWIGLIANIVLVVGYFVALPYVVTFACLPVGLGIVIVDVGGRYDDYLYSLRDQGLRWGMTVIGLWLGMWSIVSVVAVKLSNLPMSGAAIAQAVSDRLPPCMTDGYFIAIVAGLAFYAGATLAWWRGR